jgi:hypothetical protein
MQAGVGVGAGTLCSRADDEVTNIQELYGLALRVLPPALVMALTEPLLLLPQPPSALRILLPSRVPSWWNLRPLRRWHERAQGMRSSGTSTK